MSRSGSYTCSFKSRRQYAQAKSPFMDGDFASVFDDRPDLVSTSPWGDVAAVMEWQNVNQQVNIEALWDGIYSLQFTQHNLQRRTRFIKRSAQD